MNETRMAKMSIKEKSEEKNDEDNGEQEDSGPKSWADIARDRNAQNDMGLEVESAVAPQPVGVEEDRAESSSQGLSARGGRGNFRNRDRVNFSSKQRLAGRRGLTLQELQGQAQQFVLAQRLVAQANSMRVDPSFLYHTQMSQYIYHYGGTYVPMTFTTPGSVALDENSYPFLQLLREHPHLVSINQVSVVPNPAHARFFVIRCTTEQVVHSGIKYSRWEFPENYAPLLNQSLGNELPLLNYQAKNCPVGEVSGLGPVYFFFTIPSYKRCLGLAEMVSAAR